MKKLRQQINESFFNPVLHFLPLIVFMVVYDFWGLNIAWSVSLPVTLLLFVYIFFLYRKMIEWFLFSTIIFLFVGAIVTIIPVGKLPIAIRDVSLEYTVLLVFILSLVFRYQIEMFINNRKSKMLSMTNNLNELFRLLLILGSVIFVYVHAYSLLYLFQIPNLENSINFLHGAYLTAFFFVIFYECFRVTLIRVNLLREEWWPIVNEKGKIIGSIHNKTSIQEEKKYMHPVVRVMLIENNRIFLQKRCRQDILYPGFWDTAVSNHVKVNETVDRCIRRTVSERYGISELKPIFLSNYIHETECEYHYAFLFVACNLPDLEPNPKYIDQAKWWTLAQIEENRTTGIFTENFLTEFELIKRSGLLESGRCECECRLKETLSKTLPLNYKASG